MWQCKYHVIWCPKYRFKILNGALQKSVGDLLRQLCEWKKLEILEMNVQEDHVHLLLSIPPKFSVSEVVGFLKEFFPSLGTPPAFDLWRANGAVIEAAGVPARQIFVADVCTICGGEDYPSHRRQQGQAGRFAAISGGPIS